MKKKILFVLAYMNMGGVEKSFLRLVKTLPKDQYDIHLGLLRNDGPLLKEVPEFISIHNITVYEPYLKLINDAPKSTLKNLITNHNFKTAFLYIISVLYQKLFKSQKFLYNYILKDIPSLSESFDVAISYAGPSQMIDYYIVNKVSANKKIGWIHFDISKFGYDKPLIKSLYKKFDRINIVSKEAKIVFDSIFPELQHKTKLFFNKLDKNDIVTKAESGIKFNISTDKVKILTVGRITSQKGQDIALLAIKHLTTLTKNFVWYFVGGGDCLEKYKEYVLQNDISEYAFFMGMQENPYGLMKDCDIYIQTSRSEGHCITIEEAKCFNKPIIATNFCGIHEQMENYHAYSICDLDPIKLSETIYSSINSLAR